jgi:hypothetical protein
MMGLVLATLLLLCFTGVAFGFVTQAPNNQAVRIRRDITTRAFVTAGLVQETKEKAKTAVATGPTTPKITTLTSAEEYMDFLLEDDRLCMVK